MLLTNCQIKLINKNKFVEVALNKNIKTFIANTVSLVIRMRIYPAKKA